jgi:hypothetical protein
VRIKESDSSEKAEGTDEAWKKQVLHDDDNVSNPSAWLLERSAKPRCRASFLARVGPLGIAFRHLVFLQMSLCA